MRARVPHPVEQVIHVLWVVEGGAGARAHRARLQRGGQDQVGWLPYPEHLYLEVWAFCKHRKLMTRIVTSAMLNEQSGGGMLTCGFSDCCHGQHGALSLAEPAARTAPRREGFGPKLNAGTVVSVAHSRPEKGGDPCANREPPVT